MKKFQSKQISVSSNKSDIN